MKKLFLLLLIPTVFSLYSCKKKETCVCNDADGNLVRKYTFSGNQKKIDQGETDCSETKTQTYKNGVIINTPCVVM